MKTKEKIRVKVGRSKIRDNQQNTYDYTDNIVKCR